MFNDFMDFNIRKPAHIFALIVLLFVVFFVVVLPLVLFFLGSASSLNTIKITDNLLILNAIIYLVLFLGVPFLWYLLVNHESIKQMFDSLKLKTKGISLAVMWGFAAAIIIVMLEFIIGLILTIGGQSQNNISNVPILFTYTTPVVVLFVILVQSPVEEIFFRGFLLGKIDAVAGKKIAILSTAIFFGLAHFSYDQPILVFVIILMGIILGFIFVKTKNLFSSITAHVLVNLTAFILYFIGKSLGA
jgi:membrane protease YdiL (CAAX protease family)